MKSAPIIPLASKEMPPATIEQTSFSLARRLEVPVWVFDIDNRCVVLANLAACRLWQAENEHELAQRDLGKDMSVTVANRLHQYQSDFENMDATFTDLWTLYPKGKPKSVRVVFSGYRLEDGRMAMLCEAIGEFEDEPTNLRSAEALLHTDVIVTLFSREGTPLYQNPAARNAFEAPLENFGGVFVDAKDFAVLTKQVATMGEFRTVSKLQTAHGKRWYDLSVKLCSDAVTGKPALLMTAIDVSELKDARDTARYLADRDQLTNLYNRSYLQSHFAKLEDRAPVGKCAIIFFDVDRFKLINDRYGHEAGDSVLRQIAIRTRATLRTEDLVARLGGDEFVVVIEGYSTRQELDDRVSRIRAVFHEPIIHDKTRIDVEVSVGVATFSNNLREFNDVLQEADIALYASKQAGRNCVTYFTTHMGAAVKARDKLEMELKRAIENREFVLDYQPRLDVSSGQITGAEGLARWNHPERGIVMPDVFIPICEETGLIEDLGRQVLELGCAQAIEWQKKGLDICVSVNISPRQFADPTLLTTLEDMSNEPDFPTGRLELEVTENVLIGDHGSIAEKLRAITALGYNIAIDDFGTGYSNLSYISRFPLTCLKIDRSFTDQLPVSGPIIQLILTLGKQVGARIVAEGVETQEQLDWLAENQCEEVQGYFITRPMPPKDFVAFLQKDNKSA